MVFICGWFQMHKFSDDQRCDNSYSDYLHIQSCLNVTSVPIW